MYDVPPPTLSDKHCDEDRGVVGRGPQEIYDIPASLQSGGHPSQDVYDFPRDREERLGERREHNIYDIPPQVPSSNSPQLATVALQANHRMGQGVRGGASEGFSGSTTSGHLCRGSTADLMQLAHFSIFQFSSFQAGVLVGFELPTGSPSHRLQ